MSEAAEHSDPPTDAAKISKEVWSDRGAEAEPRDIVAPALKASLALASDGAWPSSSLRDVAVAAEIDPGALFRAAPSKSALLDVFSRHLDLVVFVGSAEPVADVGDRLFEAVMARLEVLEPDRFAWLALAREEGAGSPRIGPRLVRTARALLEASGIDAGGRRGGIRLAAMTAVWVRALQVWRDDEGALNRTMAEVDARIKRMRSRLARVGAGF
jgi:AcrR family transcriptional regulator